MKKILAIDDKPDNLTALTAALNNGIPDCTVITALSGQEGLDKATKEQPDTILLDIIMPSMDGFEVCKKLKVNHLTRHIPVIMLTAIKTDSESRVKGLELGADAFISKPIDIIELAAQVKVMLRIKQAEDKLRYENVLLENIVKVRTKTVLQRNTALNLEIDERKEVIRELRKSEERFRSVWEQSSEALVLSDAEGIVEAVNPAYQNLYGFSAEQLLGKSFSIIFPKQHRKAAIAQYKAIFAAKELPSSFEAVVRRADGSERIVDSRATFLVENKKRIAMLSTIRDITERKQFENQLVKANTQLEQLYKRQNEIKENERKAISREIHDELGQALSAIKIDLKWTLDYPNDKKVTKDKVEGMINIINKTIKTVQRISSDLRPSLLDDIGLIPAMEWFCHEFEKRNSIPCKFTAEFSELANEKINLALYRILQEGLTNVMRHAKATEVKVNLNNEKEGLSLKVNDNGIGMDIKLADSNESLGLIGIKERIKEFNGTFKLIAKQGKGTSLIVYIPNE